MFPPRIGKNEVRRGNGAEVQMEFSSDSRLYQPTRVQCVFEIIQEWDPGVLCSERAYENSLYSYLHVGLGNVQVTKQFAVGRARADILVGDDVLIELKHDLDTNGKFHRLLGQIADFSGWGSGILIVLCGQTDPYYKKRLNWMVDRGRVGIASIVRVIEKQQMPKCRNGARFIITRP